MIMEPEAYRTMKSLLENDGTRVSSRTFIRFSDTYVSRRASGIRKLYRSIASDSRRFYVMKCHDAILFKPEHRPFIGEISLSPPVSLSLSSMYADVGVRQESSLHGPFLDCEESLYFNLTMAGECDSDNYIDRMLDVAWKNLESLRSLLPDSAGKNPEYKNRRKETEVAA